MLSSGEGQSRNPDGSASGSHPAFAPHPMQGWSPDFIPKITADAAEMDLIDQILTIPGPEAMQMARALAKKEGIFAGISSGATFAGALKVAESAERGANILCMLPDTGERYLSTPLFGDIEAEMDTAEKELAASTPGYQLPG